MSDDEERKNRKNEQLEGLRTALNNSRNNYESDSETVRHNSQHIYVGSPIVERALEKINKLLSEGYVEDSYDYASTLISNALED